MRQNQVFAFSPSIIFFFSIYLFLIIKDEPQVDEVPAQITQQFDDSDDDFRSYKTVITDGNEVVLRLLTKNKEHCSVRPGAIEVELLHWGVKSEVFYTLECPLLYSWSLFCFTIIKLMSLLVLIYCYGLII